MNDCYSNSYLLCEIKRKIILDFAMITKGIQLKNVLDNESLEVFCIKIKYYFYIRCTYETIWK